MACSIIIVDKKYLRLVLWHVLDVDLQWERPIPPKAEGGGGNITVNVLPKYARCSARR